MAALTLISVLLKQQMHLPTFGVDCREVIAFISVMVLADFATAGLSQNSVTLLKIFSHSSMHIERAFQDTEKSSCILADCTFMILPSPHAYAWGLVHIYIQALTNSALTVPSSPHTIYFILKFYQDLRWHLWILHEIQHTETRHQAPSRP